MNHRTCISIGAIVLGVSTLTIGYAASKSGDEGMSCERMMREQRGTAGMSRQGMMGKGHVMGKEGSSMMDKNHMEMMGKDHMGMMGSGKPKECEEMMRKHGMSASGSSSARPTAPAN